MGLSLICCTFLLGIAHAQRKLLLGDAPQLYCEAIPGGCAPCSVLDKASKACAKTQHHQLLRCSSSAEASKEYEILRQPMPEDHVALTHSQGGHVIIARSCDPASSLSTSEASASAHASLSAASQHADSGERAAREVAHSSDAADSQGADAAASEASEREATDSIRDGEEGDARRSGGEGEAGFVADWPTQGSGHRSTSKQPLQARHVSTDPRHWSLFHFELGMLGLLAVALPVVYWRKIRVRHL
uniref:SURF1-like protein n=1 Tax=Chlamydomonas leiostraca TaxID=1034604 RepID=A0A7S0N822_9CHLO|mmetsp:Transcript_10224/g.25473  ORF Transcript_10224/g.25473 Transcript_10224/m.25473 type:complete len:245 (+) Transcript_10224:52-786(+)